MDKILLIILDGLADLPNEALMGQTCLEAAETPLLDRLIREGAGGLVSPFVTGAIPTSEDTHFSLFGYDVNEYQIKRGVFEALGLGIKLDQDTIAWRGNWTTLDQSGSIIDRRAGRIPGTESLISEINQLTIEGINFRVYLGREHRVVLTMTGTGLSDKLSNGYRREAGVPPSSIVPLDRSEEAIFTARVTNQYLKKIHSLLKDNIVNQERIRDGLLPANYILLRGAGRLKSVPSFSDRFGLSGACIAGGHLYRGISKLIGWDIIDVPGADGSENTNLSGKIKASIDVLREKDFVFCHIKATDNLSHKRDCSGKVNFLEKLDKCLKPLFDLRNTLIVITGDHATSCSSGEHSMDMIPLLIWGDKVKPDAVARFGESFCREGSLATMLQTEVLAKIFSMAQSN